ncbi:MAG: ZIP family metal transporter [Brevibacillus sp.]|nr:ZIP family metal transporter [Brevibacillus sp.]
MGTNALFLPLVLVLASLATAFGGILLFMRIAWSESALYAMVSAGAGLLLALTVLDLLPRSIGDGDSSYAVVILVGFLLLFVTDVLFHRRDVPGRIQINGILAGLSIHAFLEGVSLVASLQADAALGFSLIVALLLHKIPEGVTAASLLMVSSNNRLLAFIGTAALAAATLFGGLIMCMVQDLMPKEGIRVVLALATGIFLYVAMGHLVPFVQKTRHLRFPVYFVGGVLLYMLLTLLFRFHLHPHV